MAYNPFQEGAKLPQGLLGMKWPTTRLIYNWNIKDGRAAVEASAAQLSQADAAVKALGTAEIPAATKEAFDSAARTFNNSVSQLKFAEGKIGTSAKGMTRSFANVFGVDTSKWGSTKIKGEVAEAITKGSAVHGNILERVISKPMRVAARHPRAAMAVIAAGAVALIGGALGRNAEKRTEQETLAKLNDLQAQNGPVAPATANTYTVTPEESAALEAQMKQYNGQQHGGHAAAVQARAATTQREQGPVAAL